MNYLITGGAGIDELLAHPEPALCTLAADLEHVQGPRPRRAAAAPPTTGTAECFGRALATTTATIAAMSIP